METKPDRKWTFIAFFKIYVYLAVCFILLMEVPNSVFDPEVMRFTVALGALGAWRYGWWFTHFIRALIYEYRVYPRLQKEAQAVWAQGYRPRHVHFMMTTFRESREITEPVVEAMCRELRDNNLSGTIWLGSGDRSDEVIIENYLKRYHSDLDLEFICVRQNVPGKRCAIGLVLRAMNRLGIGKDDIIVFMDGDFILERGLIRRCAPLFVANPDLQAMTTGEKVIAYGPKWIDTWLKMRFAQRHMVMQSHAVSNRVLTLTGRCSLFRAQHLTKLEFIRTLEADHLEHWLWGGFRFLSGDDKSTWYTLLRWNSRMLYVPDATGYTVEHIEGMGIERMVQNFRRWSGNMLRNGSRAIALGPRRMPFFIWWCLVDQRISMWTMLVSPATAVAACVIGDPSYIVSYFIFIALTRMALSLVIYRYAEAVYISFPFILYFNQLINASVKVYCLFRLHKQKWSNRGNQSAEYDENFVYKMKEMFASYVTTIYVTGLFFFVTVFGDMLPFPGLEHLQSLFS